jgi:hypothetical protein
MVEVVIRRQVKVSDNLISSWVACSPQVHWGKILGLNEYDPILIGDSNVRLGDPFSILSVGGGSVSFPELKGDGHVPPNGE